MASGSGSLTVGTEPIGRWAPVRRAYPPRRTTLVIVAVAALGMAVFTLGNLGVAAKAATDGRALLLRAEDDLAVDRLDDARRSLAGAEEAFARVGRRIDALGPIASTGRRLPLVRSQLRAVETFATVGVDLSRAGSTLVDAASQILASSGSPDGAAVSLAKLRTAQETMRSGITAVDAARASVSSLEGLPLLGPLSGSRSEVAERLVDMRAKAVSAESGLGAMITFAGGSGPRRYLFLSQNPDEVRPTGGVIGTYGLISAHEGKLDLERYDAIDNWYLPRPEATVAPELSGSPFRFFNPPFPRTIANVNTVPDWPQAARLAMELWNRGGEEPVDGVLSFTPSVLGRILSVIGPVRVPEYDDTVTAENIIARLDFHAHTTDPALRPNRKEFIGVLAETVLEKVLTAPSSQFKSLGAVLGQAFDAREAMAWSADRDVGADLARRHWDGAVPTGPGDFFLNGEIEYYAKNGRGIRRIFDHHVEIHPDGSARITTQITMLPRNSDVDQAFHSYIVLYGPRGAALAEGSDPPRSLEPAVGGHPAAGWFRGAGLAVPQDTLKVVWDAPDIAVRMPDGAWQYSLRWMRLPDHTGDVLNLSFHLPQGWRWRGPPPPTQFDLGLGRDLVGSWLLTSAGDT